MRRWGNPPRKDKQSAAVQAAIRMSTPESGLKKPYVFSFCFYLKHSLKFVLNS